MNSSNLANLDEQSPFWAYPERAWRDSNPKGMFLVPQLMRVWAALDSYPCGIREALNGEK